MDLTNDTLDAALIEAWRAAAADLCFRLDAPYRLRTSTGDNIWVEGFLPDFGGKSGMIFRGIGREAPCTDLYVSLISTIYRVYEQGRFIEALTDWGWFGPANARPTWLTSNDT